MADARAQARRWRASRRPRSEHSARCSAEHRAPTVYRTARQTQQRGRQCSSPTRRRPSLQGLLRSEARPAAWRVIDDISSTIEIQTIPGSARGLPTLACRMPSSISARSGSRRSTNGASRRGDVPASSPSRRVRGGASGEHLQSSTAIGASPTPSSTTRSNRAREPPPASSASSSRRSHRPLSRQVARSRSSAIYGISQGRLPPTFRSTRRRLYLDSPTSPAMPDVRVLLSRCREASRRGASSWIAAGAPLRDGHRP